MFRPSSKLKWKLAKPGFYFNRFRALPRAERLFRDVTPGTILERRLFGHRYFCDVSRVGPQKLLYLTGERNIAEASLIQQMLCPGMRVVDVGANIGYYMLMFAQSIGPTGKIIAIEPSPENLPELELNVKMNDLHNVQIVPKAVGNQTKIVGLSGGINSGVVVGGAPAFHVEIDCIDNIITEPIDFIKIDIEGYEGLAIEGAQQTISEYRPTVFMEIHPASIQQHGSSVGQIVGALSRFYDCITLYAQRRILKFHEKAFFYYTGRGGITKITDSKAFIDLCDKSEKQDPFWVVCQELKRTKPA